MAIATKELTTLGKRREELLGERKRLMEEAEKLRERNLMVGDLPRQIQAIESELAGLNPTYKEARREAGRLAASRLDKDKPFQMACHAALEVIGSLAALERQAVQLRAEGVALPPLPVPLALWLKGWAGWFAALARVGAVDVAALPPELRALVEKGDQ